MRLLIFTQKIDRNDSVLGFFHSWIVEFAKHCESVSVICLYKGDYDLPNNVEVYSLGKEEGLGRIVYLKNLFSYLGNLSGKYDRVFVHMNPIYIVLLGLYFEVKRIPIYLWYVHRNVDAKLRLSVLFAQKVFTSAKESFNLKSDKVVFLGHGLDVARLPNSSHQFTGEILNITHIGRITPIKNLEILLEACVLIKSQGFKLELSLLGETATVSDLAYKRVLEQQISQKDLKNEVIFAGAIPYSEIPNKLATSHITVNLAPSGGMDKAVLEAIVLGIPTFVSNEAFKGMLGEYQSLFLFEDKNPRDLADKILSFLKDSQNQNIINKLSEKVRKDFSLESLISKMVVIMK